MGSGLGPFGPSRNDGVVPRQSPSGLGQVAEVRLAAGLELVAADRLLQRDVMGRLVDRHHRHLGVHQLDEVDDIGVVGGLVGGEAGRIDQYLRVKINAVALKGVNEDEIEGLMQWAHGLGMDLTLIEVMPLGDIEPARLDQFLPLSMVRANLMDRYTLDDDPYRTGGPARYVRVRETGGLVGFITPMTHNFCESCNRVRLTCTGTLYMCLGQEDAADLRAPIRASSDDALLYRAMEEAISRKPKGHDFVIDRRQPRAAVGRHMSVTGG